MKEFVFHISAFRQVDLTEKNILNIRNNFTELKDCPIIVTSTAPEDPGFGNLAHKYKDVYFLHFDSAPGNPHVIWKSRQTHPEWRIEYLPPRILLPIQHVMRFVYSCGSKFMLHLHSDSFWNPRAEDMLLHETEHLKCFKIMFRGDLSALTDDVGAIPRGTHFQPEGLLFNLEECYRWGYGFDFHEIWDEGSGFASHNYCALEALFGQFAAWKLTGACVTKPDDVLPHIYREKVSVRCKRIFHGEFSHLTNLPGTQ